MPAEVRRAPESGLILVVCQPFKRRLWALRYKDSLLRVVSGGRVSGENARQDGIRECVRLVLQPRFGGCFERLLKRPGMLRFQGLGGRKFRDLDLKPGLRDGNVAKGAHVGQRHQQQRSPCEQQHVPANRARASRGKAQTPG
jgi:hypothetical protein